MEPFSPLASWLLLSVVCAVVVVAGLAFVRLVFTALGATRWVGWLDAWAEATYGGSVSWNPERTERRMSYLTCDHDWIDTTQGTDESVRCDKCGTHLGGAAAWQVISVGGAR